MINFKKFPDLLAPAIVQDADTNVVLMLGYMNEESLQKTRDTKRVTFFSATGRSCGPKARQAEIT